jgi:rfaE bifunctional protein nucleotidyltransferase chain/domain
MPFESKIKSLDQLALATEDARSKGKKIVHCHGVFDLLHVGHIRHFEEARRFGDLLVVTVTPDIHVNKGPHRPVFTQSLRAEAIAALGCVDLVAINQWPTAVETVQLVRPDFYVKGPDYKDSTRDHSGGIDQERAAAESVGAELVFTEDITFSSSNLINRHFSHLPEEADRFFEGFRTRYRPQDVFKYLYGAEGLRVLVVGETIIDEYQYCQTMGKSGKEPMLAARYLGSEKFAGGVLAAANHVASFSEQVGLVSVLGTLDSHEDFIREALAPRIQPSFLHLEGAPTLVKRRFVEDSLLRKLFEIYVMERPEGMQVPAEPLCELLREMLPHYDVVIVVDYGHGMLGPEAVELLCKEARFLAINTQVNAHNHGFNTVSKYTRADYICIAEHELRLEARCRSGDIRAIVRDVSERLGCGRVLITKGARGSLGYSAAEGFVDVPAFVGAGAVVDRVGAGDAVLSVTSLCVAQGAPTEIVGVIANAVGSEAVGTVGNRRPTQRTSLLRYIESLTK